MKATKTFNQIIEDHLKGLAAKDPLFAETFANPKKTIQECVNYILGNVLKSGCNGFADEEIFGMAVHYYDEADITAPNAINAKVIHNQSEPKTPNKAAVQSKVEQPKKAAKQFAATSQQSLF